MIHIKDIFGKNELIRMENSYRYFQIEILGAYIDLNEFAKISSENGVEFEVSI